VPLTKSIGAMSVAASQGTDRASSEVESKLRGMLVIRLVLTMAVILGAPIFFRAYAPPLYLFAGTHFLLTLVYVFLLKWRFEPKLFANIQVFADVVLVTLLIALTGWENSKFGFFYIIPITTASMFFRLPQSISIALLSSILYAAVVFYHRYHVPVATQESHSEVLYSLYVRTIVFCMVGYLCGHLVNRLRAKKDELRELKSLHNLILTSMDSGLITTDGDNMIIYANRAAEETLGFALPELYNRNIEEYFSTQEKGSLQEVLDSALRKQRRWEKRGLELRARTVEGKELPIGFNLSAIKDSSGQPVGKVMVFSDLTEVKELERRLRTIDKFQAAGELAAGIAHEIRNPLTSISGSIEMLRESGNVSKTDRELLSVIRKESDRLNRIIEDFLCYARRGSLDMKKEDVREIVKESIAMLQRGRKLGAGIRIDLVAPETPGIVSADKSQMSQVFLNLLTNAVDAMNGSGTISIRISSATRNGDYSVTISDTGQGIPMERLGRVFEPFFTTKREGVGIGLCIAERFVREHNGQLRIVSEEGKGTSVTVVIPREQGVGKANAEGGEVEKPAGHSPKGGVALGMGSAAAAGNVLGAESM
jgi:two-component system sensor histidine kinase PilS (NtrC family)